MEIEDNTNQPPSKAPITKSNPSIISPPSKLNGKPEHSWKNSLDKISSNDLANSINHIEEMIHDIQVFSKKRTNVEVCHYCQTQCEKQYLLHCTKEDCPLYFCLRCLNQEFRMSLMNIYMITKSEAWSWSCPFCRGECTCQKCKPRISLGHEAKAENNNQQKKKVEEKPEGKINLSPDTTPNHSTKDKKEKNRLKQPNRSPKEEKKTLIPIKEPSPEPEEPKIELEVVEKKNIKVSPKGKENTERPVRKSTKSKDGLRKREKAQSPPQIKSPSTTMEIESKPAKMGTRLNPLKEKVNEKKGRKPKVTRMTTRYSEKWAEVNLTKKKTGNRNDKVSPAKSEEGSEKSYQFESEEEKITSKKPAKSLPPAKEKSKNRDPSPMIEEKTLPTKTEKSEKLNKAESKEENSNSQKPAKSKSLALRKKDIKKRELSPEVGEKFRKNIEVNLTKKKAENAEKKISPSKTEESEKSPQLEPEEEKNNSKKQAKNSPLTKEKSNKRDPTPMMEEKTLPSKAEVEAEAKQAKLNSKKATKVLSPTKKQSKKRDPSCLIEEEPEQNEETSSQLPDRSAKRSLKKSRVQKARKKTPKKERKKKEFARHWKEDDSEELSFRIKKDEKGDQQRKMVTRSTEKAVASKSVTAKSSSQSEESCDLFEIKKISETKASNESKDEWNKNGKRVLSLLSDEEFVLEEEKDTHKAYYSYRQKSPEIHSAIVLEKEEKVTVELSKCHYCVDMKRGEEGMTCCNSSCRIFFCSACIRKHPEEDPNKVSDANNWKCLVCEDRCTCIDCLQVLFRSKMGQKDGSNQNKMVQECLDRVRHIRNENLVNEMNQDLDLLDDSLQSYTLKKKRDNANPLLDITNSMEKKKEEGEPMILEMKPGEEPQPNPTEMLSEKKSLVAPEGIADVNGI